ncbi:MAG: FHA domain-containing protein [Bacteriovoracales bacterium]|nr:FHA domain-containing protein [Bacteriovoracales bacterium]
MAISEDSDQEKTPNGEYRPGTPILVVEIPEQDEPQEFPLASGKSLKLGRGNVDIVLEHHSLSNSHCSFSCEEGVVSVIDHSSTNGTFVNRKKIAPNRRVIIGVDDEIYMALVKGSIRIPLQKRDEKDRDSDANQHKDKPKEDAPPIVPKTSQNQGAKGKTQKVKVPIKRRMLTPPKSKSKPKTKKQKTPALTHPFFRLLALIGDTLLTVFFEPIVKSMSFFQTLMGTLSDPISSDLSSLLTFVLIFFVFRLIGILFFGVSPTQALMGLRGGHGFLRNRLGGLLRLFWEMLLGNFIIFDIPLLFKKRSAKEFLSGTLIVNGPLSVRILSSVTLLPLLAVLSITGDFFAQWDYRQGLSFKKYNLPPKEKGDQDKKDKDTANSFVLELTSKIFQYSGRVDLNEQKAFLILGYDISSENKKKTFRPHLALFDRRSGQGVTFGLDSKRILHHALTSAVDSDPFLLASYPKALLQFSNNAPPKKFLGKEETQKIRALLEKALGLNIGDLIGEITSGRLAVMGLTHIRKVFIDHFKMTPDSSVQWIELSESPFLKIDVLKTPFENVSAKSYLMRIDSTQAPLYKLSYASRDKGENAARTLLELLRDGGNFGPPSSSPSQEKISLGRCIDLLLNAKTPYSKIESLYAYYLNYMKELIESHQLHNTTFLKKNAERAFLIRELSSLKELDILLSKRYPEWNQSFSGRGFQSLLDEMENKK